MQEHTGKLELRFLLSSLDRCKAHVDSDRSDELTYVCRLVMSLLHKSTQIAPAWVVSLIAAKGPVDLLELIGRDSVYCPGFEEEPKHL